LANDEKLPLMMHAAESRAEKQLMLEGRGPFAEGLKKRGIDWQAPRVSTIEHLARHGVMDTKPLLAHCVNVDDHDLGLIKRSGAGIAHCAKSNAKLGHGRAPFARFLATEINVGLGSDSVASNNACDILEEARFAALLARLDSEVTAEQIFFAATLGGARALGLQNQIGALKDGMQADIIVVGLNGAHQQPVHNPIDALIFSSSGSDVQLTIAAGKEIFREGRVTAIDEDSFLSRVRKVRNKLETGS
jgi:cytosine/adenosine deaminase-related metal-dependent hydrolase